MLTVISQKDFKESEFENSDVAHIFLAEHDSFLWQEEIIKCFQKIVKDEKVTVISTIRDEDCYEGDSKFLSDDYIDYYVNYLLCSDSVVFLFGSENKSSAAQMLHLKIQSSETKNGSLNRVTVCCPLDNCNIDKIKELSIENKFQLVHSIEDLAAASLAIALCNNERQQDFKKSKLD